MATINKKQIKYIKNIVNYVFDLPLDYPDRDLWQKYSDELYERVPKLLRAVIKENTPGYRETAQKLHNLNQEIDDLLEKITHTAATFATLGEFVNAIDKLLNLATSVFGGGIFSLAAVEEGATFRSAERMPYRLDPSVIERLTQTLPPEEDVVDGQPENEPVVDSPVEQIPVEEILHGIELTPESVVITVATGGRTEKNSFEVDVVPGNTGLSPYLVIIYRVKSDESKGDFEPIRISFSRKELGLEGKVDFRVLNRIGNTSQHRLNS